MRIPLGGGTDEKLRVHERPTSFDIAYRAGVSQSTVSRALRGDPNVNEETRRKIEAIARELKYKVDKNASNLRRQRSNTIAVLFFEDPSPDPSQINPFFLSMLGSITRACAKRSYDLLISFQKFAQDWNEDYEDSGKADGLILLGYGDYVDYRQHLEQLVEQGTRFVRWGAVEEGQPGVSIGSDNFNGARIATEHLIGLGRRAIAFLGDSSNHAPEFSERHRGYSAAMQADGLPESFQAAGVSSEEAGAAAALALIESGVPFDGIVAASDLIAAGALAVLRDKGFDVPRDVSVIGYDDIPAASFVNPALTTVAQDTWLAGEKLVETLLKMMQGEVAESAKLPARLIIRRSCGAKKV
ncbi:DNA-binding LacI/PurR family transcriptional regulator [Rhizomicrobium palustre]|uniref:DNA-binding LacI/PurR family transcriptional regulator n=1 Tax=Rhizomicrobium palustre TaxID=189966 RepID=A0A846MXR2_9PROT|nr:LacI family DNA-binding transcriptional regulator [Rhizomicrobium palustre]NIK88378.1 DNA-binding LacI/PurR family transcriptional regulator [Rhizomicrobium palustre]